MSHAENHSNTPHETVLINNSKQVLHVNMTNVSRLTSTNYLMWSRQVHALLDGYELAGFLDGSVTQPSSTITVGDTLTPNPDFTLWKRQDKLLYSALLGAISLTIQPLLSRASTTSEIWSTLASTYAKPSRGHIKQIKQQIKQWTKGTKTIDEYFQGLTTRLDQLAILGKPLDHEDQIDCILAGLPEDYKNIVDQIEGRDVPPSLTELHEKLINQESKLQHSAPLLSLPVSANATINRNNSRPNQRFNSKHLQPWNNQQNQKTEQRQFKPYLGRCQFCGTQGHSARRCPHLSAVPPPPPFAQGSFNSPTPWQPRANVATATQPPSTPWLLDSGATHHITSDLHNLSLHQPYNGGDEVLLGDNSGEGSQHGCPVIPRKN